MSRKENVHLRLLKGFSINGVLPLTICDISPGEKWGILIDGVGLENRKGYLLLDDRGNPRIEGERLGAILKNAVLPGWGAVSTSRKVSGWTDFSLIVFSLGYFLKENKEYDDLYESYDSLKDLYESSLSYEERLTLGKDLNTAALELNVQNTHRKRILLLTAVMYGYQFLDPLFFNRPPGYRSEAGGSILEIEAASSGKAKAFFHSLVCPGRGQFYQGKKTRGFLYAGLNAAAGFFALDRLNAFDEKAMYYDMYVDEYNSAVTAEDRSFYRGKAEEAWSDLEDAKKDRDFSYILLASLWSLNLIDTFFETDKIDNSSDLGLELGPSGAALVLSF
ncbi:MAG: hypothetical protein JW746_10320 [Candidatus Krumholzibacteriota bacterium]|nr:hypothetical protein [Candidatus Krumholzibacteriota bacterium]